MQYALPLTHVGCIEFTMTPFGIQQKDDIRQTKPQNDEIRQMKPPTTLTLVRSVTGPDLIRCFPPRVFVPPL